MPNNMFRLSQMIAKPMAAETSVGTPKTVASAAPMKPKANRGSNLGKWLHPKKSR